MERRRKIARQTDSRSHESLRRSHQVIRTDSPYALPEQRRMAVILAESPVRSAWRQAEKKEL